MKPNRYTSPPSGLLLKELQPGYLYQDRLSGLPVLVVLDEHRGPDEKDPRRRVKSKLLRGRFYNPVYGAHQWIELVDRQLIRYEQPTER